MALDPVSAPPTDVSNTLLRTAERRSPGASWPPSDRALLRTPGLSQARADGVRVSCADCTCATDWFSDRAPGTRSRSASAGDRAQLALAGERRLLPLVRVDGGADSLWAQGKHAFTAAATMNGSRSSSRSSSRSATLGPLQQLFGRRCRPSSRWTVAGLGRGGGGDLPERAPELERLPPPARLGQLALRPLRARDLSALDPRSAGVCTSSSERRAASPATSARTSPTTVSRARRAAERRARAGGRPGALHGAREAGEAPRDPGG